MSSCSRRLQVEEATAPDSRVWVTRRQSAYSNHFDCQNTVNRRMVIRQFNETTLSVTNQGLVSLDDDTRHT